jgi:DNA-directed RNA polymerase subunit beta'
VIVGRLIPAGTGLAYHAQRRKNASGLTESEMEALSGTVTAEPEAVVEAAARDQTDAT